MAYELANSPDDKQVFTTIVDFVKGKDFSPKNFDALAAAEEFMSRYSAIDENDLLFNIPTFGPEDLSFGPGFSKDDKENIYTNLTHFFQELKALAGLEYVRKKRGFTRTAIPPVEAYEYVGHNKLNITESKLAAALLYE